MNYRELGSAAETDITARNYSSLIDAPVKLYEEEISNCDTEMENGVTRSNPQGDHQNLDVTSTSSSRNPPLLPDLNTIPPDEGYRELRSAAETDISSRRFCALVDVAGMLHEEEERDERIFCLFPRKTRTSVKNGVSRKKNLDWTSSSRKPSLLLPDLNTIPPDEGYPRNPNSSSSLLLLDLNTIPADSESADITDEKLDKEILESLVQLMNDVNETVSKWGKRTLTMYSTLIFQGKLFKTDVNKDGRLLMPFNELICKDFLKPVESGAIEKEKNNKKKIGIGAILFDQRNVKWGVMLKRWKTRGTLNYALTCGWKDVVEANGLKQGDDISIWSFRWGGLLCFALVTPPSMAQSSSSRALCL